MIVTSHADCLRLSQALIRLVQSEIAAEQAPLRVTQAQIGKRLKISRSMVQQVFGGKRIFGQEFFEAIAQERSVSLKDFLKTLGNQEGRTFVPTFEPGKLKALDELSDLLSQISVLAAQASSLLKSIVSFGGTARSKKKKAPTKRK